MPYRMERMEVSQVRVEPSEPKIRLDPFARLERSQRSQRSRF